MIDPCKHGAILPGNLNVLSLRGRHPEVVRSPNGQLLLGRLCPKSVPTAVVADAHHRIVDVYVTIDVNVASETATDTGHVAVVSETVAGPSAAIVPVTVVSAAVVHAAVIAN